MVGLNEMKAYVQMQMQTNVQSRNALNFKIECLRIKESNQIECLRMI